MVRTSQIPVLDYDCAHTSQNADFEIASILGKPKLIMSNIGIKTQDVTIACGCVVINQGVNPISATKAINIIP